jgi:hypothetical protein
MLGLYVMALAPILYFYVDELATWLTKKIIEKGWL